MSTLPTAFGEKVVLRLFDKAGVQPRAQTLGIEGQGLTSFGTRSRLRHDLISGPTGAADDDALRRAQRGQSVHKNLVGQGPDQYHIDAVNPLQTTRSA